MQRRLIHLVVLLLLPATAWSAGGGLPVAVSPGASRVLELVANNCPTFSWAGVDEAAGYTLNVYEVTESGQLGKTALYQAFPAGASSWTVSEGRCLGRGVTYAWAVAATGGPGGARWSEPVVFEVAGGPTEMELQEALALAGPYLADQSGLPVEMRHQLETEPETIDAVVVDGSVPAAPAATRLSVDGNVHALSFTGDGTTLGGVATDTELTNHAAVSDVHHTKTVDTTCSGAACDGTNFTNIQWENLANRPPGLDDGDDGVYAAGPGLALTGTTFSLATGPALAPMDNSVEIAANGGDYTSITLGADGLPVVSYTSRYGALMVAKCSTADCSSATLSIVDSAGDAGFTSITLGADGLPVVSYHDSDDGNLKVAKCGTADCSSATLSTVDSAGDQATSITLGTDGLPVVSYEGNGGLKVAKCHDADCSSATLSTVESASNIGFTSITLGADGLPVVSYYAGDLKVAKCTDAACSSATLSTVETARVGNYGSITLGADGLPVVSYCDWDNLDLNVAKCHDAACSSATLSTVDSAGDVGLFNSITIGGDGLPVVSYYDWGNYDLKVAKCADAACSSATSSTVDSTGSVGLYTSITVGADGLPIVSYQRYEIYLKVAHCGSVFCVPYLGGR